MHLTSPYLIVIPAYNAAPTLPALVQQIVDSVGQGAILVMDDGSTDETAAVASRLPVLTIRHEHNLGKGAALRRGLDYALSHGYQSVVTIDADLQHAPADIPRLLCLGAARRLVLGRRLGHSAMPMARRLSNFLTSLVISIWSRKTVPDSQCGFRLIPCDLIRNTPLRSGGFQMESELLLQAARLGYEIAAVPIDTSYARPTSHVRPFRDTLNFLVLLWRGLWA